MNIWDILGIEATTDKKAVQKAYKAKLWVTRPEDDQDAFMQLREAYESALCYDGWLPFEEAYDQAYEEAEYEEEYKKGHWEAYDTYAGYKPSEREKIFGKWTQEVNEVYEDYEKRNQAANWKKLLYDNIPYQIEYYEECRQYIHGLLYGFFGTIYMAREARILIDEFFSFCETPPERVKSDNRIYLNALNRHFKLNETIEFDKLIPDQKHGEEIDDFLNQYDEMVQNDLLCYETSQMEQEEDEYDLKETVRELKEHKIFYLPLECLDLALNFADYTAGQVEEKIAEWKEQWKNAEEVQLLEIEYQLYLGKEDEAKKRLGDLYYNTPVKNYCVIYQMAVCCMKVAMWYEAYMLVKMLTWLDPTPYLGEMAEHIYKTMQQEYIRKEEAGEYISDLEHIWMCRMYLRSNREEDATTVLDQVKDPSAHIWEYEMAHCLCIFYQEAKKVHCNLYVLRQSWEPPEEMVVEAAVPVFEILKNYPKEKLSSLDRLEWQELCGRYLFEQRKFKECEKLCDALLEEYPISYPILLLRGYADYCEQAMGPHKKCTQNMDFSYLIDALPQRIEARLVSAQLCSYVGWHNKVLEVLEPVKEKIPDHYRFYEIQKNYPEDRIRYLEEVRQFLLESTKRELGIPPISKYRLLDMRNIFVSVADDMWQLGKRKTEYFSFLEQLQYSKFNHPEQYMEWGLFYIKSNQEEKAIEAIKKEIAKETDQEERQYLYQRLIYAHANLGQIEEGQKYISYLEGDNKSQAYERLGYGAYGQDDFETAIFYLKKGIEESFAMVDNFAFLGLAYQKLGRYDEAIETFRQGIKICKKSGDYDVNSNLYHDIYLAYVAQGKWDEAREALEEMRVQTKLEQFKKKYYYDDVGFLYWQHNADGSYTDQIIDLWEKAVYEKIEYALLYDRLAELYQEKGQFQKAIETLQKGIEIQTGSKDYDGGNLYNKLYWCYLEAGMYKESLKAANLLNEDTSNDWFKWQHPYKIALSSMFLGDYETAYENYKKSIDTGIYEDGQYRADTDLRLCCYNMGRYEEACALAEKLSFDYEEISEPDMDIAMQSRFMLDGTMNTAFVERVETYLLEKLNSEADKITYIQMLSKLYMLKGEKELSDSYRIQAGQYYEETGKDDENSLKCLDTWRYAYQGEFEKAYDIFSQIEEYKQPVAGSSYGEYCYFKKMCNK